MDWRTYKKEKPDKWVSRIKQTKLLLDPRLKHDKHRQKPEAVYILDPDNKLFLRKGKNNMESNGYNDYTYLKHRNI